MMGKIKEHVSEPLFGAVLMVFLITAIIRPLFLDAIPKIVNFDLSFWLIAGIGIATIYFIYIYFKKDVRNYRFFGIPGLIFLIVLFMSYAQPYLSASTEYRTSPWAQHNIGWDFTVFSIIAAMWLLLYALYVHKLLKPRFAAVLAIFFSALLIYSMPATLPYLTSGDMFDSHYFYGMAERTIATGHMPDKDYLVYPAHSLRDENRDPCDVYGTDYCKLDARSNLSGTFWSQHIEDFPEDMLKPSEESGLEFGGTLHVVFIPYVYSILEPLGFDLYDVMMLYGAIFGSLTIFVVYLFMRDLFAEMKPYNYICGLLAAFMLVFTPLFATRAVAGVGEDEPLGIFLMVSTFLLFVLAFRRRSLLYAVLAGFVFLLFSLSWGPSGYVPPIMGVFMSLYAIAQFIHKKSCVSHLIYFVVPILIGVFFKQFIAHPHNSLTLTLPGLMALVPLGGAIFLSVILEIIRTRMYGVIEIKEEKIEDRIENLFHKNIYQIGGGILIVCLIMLILMGPSNAFNLVYDQITGVSKESVVRHTIAEQRDLCKGLDCVKSVIDSLRLAGCFAWFMLFILFYVGIAKRSMGALLLLSWAVPVLWNWIYSSQGGFAASLPLVLLGSTIGLFAAANRRDLEDLRIIATVLILISVPYYLFVDTSGVGIMHLGEGGDIHYWMPSLQHLNETNPEDAVITWWDYGHWIIPISHRPVLANNIQSEYEIQDVARFFVNKTSEDEAFEIVNSVNTVYNNYNKINDKNPEIKRDVGGRANGTIGVNYALIDWTMIGKSSALHWIATGDVAEPELYTFEDIEAHKEWCENNDVAEDKAALCNDPDNLYSWCGDIDKIREWCGDPDEFAIYRSESYTQCSFLRPGYIPYQGWPTKHMTDLNTQPKICSIEDKTAGKCPPGVDAGYTFGTRRIVFTYAGGANSIAGLNLEVFEVDEGYGIHNIYVIDWYGEQHSWDTWAKTHNASILGVQSFDQVIINALNYGGDGYLNFPTLVTLLYVEDEWQDFMLTQLYLGTDADSYYTRGLCRSSWCSEAPDHLKHFKLVDGFKGDVWDKSTLGYVRVWKILYDSDDDGIMDDVDQCLNEPETYNNYSDEDGCPDAEPANLSISDLIPGLKEGSVIFYHADWCPHCVKMEPWVAELTGAGYEFYDLYNKDPEFEAKKALVLEHLSDIIDVDGGVPQFGCVSNKKKHIGEFPSKEDMQNFADECVAASEG